MAIVTRLIKNIFTCKMKTKYYYGNNHHFNTRTNTPVITIEPISGKTLSVSGSGLGSQIGKDSHYLKLTSSAITTNPNTDTLKVTYGSNSFSNNAMEITGLLNLTGSATYVPCIPYYFIRTTATQSVGTGLPTPTVIAFTTSVTETVDTFGCISMTDYTNGILTLSAPGLYKINVSFLFASGTYSTVALYTKINGTFDSNHQVSKGNATSISNYFTTTIVDYFSAGTTIQFFPSQSSAGSVNLTDMKITAIRTSV